MTAQPSLFDATPAPAKSKRGRGSAEDRPMCSCGHEMLHHDKKGCSAGRGNNFGGCPCKKMRDRKTAREKPMLKEPTGAIKLWRPDTKKPKVMGWALVEGTKALIFIDRKTKVANAFGRAGSDDAKLAHRVRVGMILEARLHGDCARKAIVDAGMGKAGRPARVTLTRVCPGKPDDDGLVSALKHVRDGVASALGFNDAEFSIAGQVEGKVPLFYVQRGPGKGQGSVRGVLIEVQFTGS